MEIKKILVLFKTHLDIGFTDFSANVIDGYMNNFIPSAIKTANDLREMNADASFRWTTGSWLVDKYLESNEGDKKQQLIDAVNRGDICWHALPFTTHTEFMSKALFEYGISISKRLDTFFGKNTIAAKMTDVPGHTKAMIPLLKKAGIELLHIGVNPASAVPDVPEIFRWKADSGEEITVIYNGEYGNFTPLGDTGTALYFAHTNDNLGAQSAEEVKELFESIRKEYPDALITAADLNDVALTVREIVDTLPVITDEFGDSWIHGTGTDPLKVSQFRALERVFESLPEGEDKETLAKGLIMIPEHTWGLDEKTHLHDNINYTKADFYAHRNDESYKKMEKSWAEQRGFMYDAVSKLSPEVKAECEKAMSEAQRKEADISGMREIKVNEITTVGNSKISIGETGKITFLELSNKIIVNNNKGIFEPLYEQFSYDEYIRLHKRYHRIDVDWAIEDFTKIGMEVASKQYYSCGTSAKAYTDGEKIIIKYLFDPIAVKEMGAPARADAIISFDDDKMLFDFGWFDKPANRVAEALWLSFGADMQNPRISKFGSEIDPYHVVSRGNRNLHATDFGFICDSFSLELVDSALISPGLPHLVDFVNKIPEKNEPYYFNLYNNVWGTNFPMWYDFDARFRFVIR